VLATLSSDLADDLKELGEPGMVLLSKDDPRPWTVVHAYSFTALEGHTNHTDWKVGSAVPSPASKEREL
jgi:hypothetical protein